MQSVLTPLDFLARSAYVYPDRIAAVDGDRRFTYDEFNRRVHRLASALRRHGVAAGRSRGGAGARTPSPRSKCISA